MDIETVAQTRKGTALCFPLGVYNETDLLRQVALWGPVGAEAVLAQFYSPVKSLFHSDMNVPVARKEAIQFANLLRNHGVQSIFVRDQIATTLPVTQDGVSRVKDPSGKQQKKFIRSTEDEDYEKRTHQEQMDFMHLDTFSGPIGKKEIAVCEEEASRRKIKFFTRKDGVVELHDTDLTFIDYLAGENELVIIPREEQQSFGCNFLALDEHKVVVPLDSNTYTNSAFESRGKVVIPANLHESTKGYGAAHCMTGQLYRENSNGT